MKSSLDAVLSSAVERGDVPGVVGVAVDRDGAPYEGAFGSAQPADHVAMCLDSIFPIASMTKGLTSLAVLQAVDEGILSLDAPVGDVHSALAAPSVLTADGSVRPAARPITLRHLLTHTAGIAYPFSSPRLVETLAARGIPVPSPSGPPDGRLPLLFEPGDGWQYGFGLDWAGEVLEHATGRSLPDIMRERVLEPLGMTETSFSCDDAWRFRLVTAHTRRSDGSLEEKPAQVPPPSRSGGAGLLSSAPSYARFLRFMLGDGTFEGRRLLSETGMFGLCSDQIPGLVAGAWKTGVPRHSNDADFTEGGTAGHSLGFLYSRRAGPTGRSVGTLSWAGLSNCYFWIDRSEGVAAAVFMRILPFADAACLRLRDTFERAVYRERG